jgi:hypothetical protein
MYNNIMPSGCEFICYSEECQNHGTGFVMTAPWPMAKIGLVITEDIKSGNIEKSNYLKSMRDEGRKYACINLPNDAKLPTVAYRVHLWSPTANVLWEYDIPSINNSIEESIASFEFPDKCPASGGELKTFRECLSEGIKCPNCGKELFQSRWFSIDCFYKEKEKE